MARSIGSQDFDVWRKGRLVRAQQQIAVVPADPGVDGVGVVLGGFVAGPVEVELVVTVADATAARAKLEAYRALHGTAQTVVDQFGESFAGVIVLNVVAHYDETANASAVRVVSRWTLLVQTDRPA